MTHPETCAGAKRARVCTTPQDNASTFQRSASHRALANLSGGQHLCGGGGGEMKGQEVSGGLRGHSAQQAQAAAASLSSASPPKNRKGESDGVRGHADASVVKAIGWSVFCGRL